MPPSRSPPSATAAWADGAGGTVDHGADVGGIGVTVRRRVDAFAHTRKVHRHPLDAAGVQLRTNQVPIPRTTVGAMHKHQRCFIVATGHVDAPFVPPPSRSAPDRIPNASFRYRSRVFITSSNTCVPTRVAHAQLERIHHGARNDGAEADRTHTEPSHWSPLRSPSRRVP